MRKSTTLRTGRPFVPGGAERIGVDEFHVSTEPLRTLLDQLRNGISIHVYVSCATTSTIATLAITPSVPTRGLVWRMCTW